MDTRRLRTRLRLQRALRELLAEMPLDSIPVETLARRAGVTRATFYAHYEGLPQMLDDYLSELLGEIELRHQKLLHGAPPEEREERMRSVVASVFSDLDPGDARLVALLRGVPSLDAEARFARLVEGFLERGDPDGDARLTPAERQLHAHYFTGAFFGLLRLWLVRGTELDADTLAHHFARLCLNGRLCTAAPTA